MKRILLLFAGILLLLPVKAQLNNGDIAPDWTLQDLDGNTWHLYELLDQGKSVFLDFSATWCGPCWSYHNSGALENLYDQYGPDGTDELMVFMIEGDPSTNLDCIYDLPGCNSSSQGDWTAGTPYPIINDDFVANDYNINYWPTIYHVCPNRLIQEIGQPNTAQAYALIGGCAVAVGDNNAGLLRYESFSGAFCGTKVFSPVVKIQNLGYAQMTSAVFECYINGELFQSLDWSGDLGTYGLEDITFDEVTLDADAEISFRVESVNGNIDEDEANNEIIVNTNRVDAHADNYLTLELRTDPYPRETYWEVRNGSDKVLYWGGNRAVLGFSDDGGAYTNGNYVYNELIPVPADDCYSFRIYDSYGDGICCVEGNGYYKLKLQDGTVVAEGGEFATEDSSPFDITGSSTPIANNGAIFGYLGPTGDFCGSMEFAPLISLRNLGTDTIATAVIDVFGNGELVGTTNWTGSIQPAANGSVQLDPVVLTDDADLELIVRSINGEDDNFTYRNSRQVSLARNFTADHDLIMNLKVDSYGFEIYWQITNSAGEVMASGGNEVVGPNGGGLRVASASDPGAYAANEEVIEVIDLPDGLNDCYTFLIVDDYGDGMVDGGGGYVSFQESNLGGDVLYVSYDNTAFTSTGNALDVEPIASAIVPIPAVERIVLYPNPARERVTVDFTLHESVALRMTVYNMLGQVVERQAERNYPAGQYKETIDISGMDGGLYYVELEQGNRQVIRKFSVVR